MKTIIDTAVDAGNFTTLLDALKAASMKDTLRAPGPYTLFAPTDDAFKRLAPGVLEALVKDVKRLQAVLSRHIAPGTHTTKSILPGDIKVIEGAPLVASLHGSDVSVSGAKVVKPDIAASNGVIHAIDTVILPPSARLAAVA
jgi:uncharacterized surface protein with fasciclin (FAS1) repeats